MSEQEAFSFAAGDTYIGLACLAGTVYYATHDCNGKRFRDPL
jgi:hypothetical protein